MDPDRLRELLPWRYPFLMVDRLVDCVPHESIATVKAVVGDDLLARSAARRMAVPGAMVLEGLNQSAALLFQLTYGKVERARLPLLGYLVARFPGTAEPGAEIEFSVTAVKMTPERGLFEGAARVAGRTIAEGELAFSVVPPEVTR